MKVNKRISAAIGFSALVFLGSGSAMANIVVLGGNPAGSLWYAQSEAIASVVNTHTNMRVDVLPQSGTVYFPMFGTGEVDLGVASPIEALPAYLGEWPFEQASGGEGYEMLTIMLGSPMALSLVTQGDSDIESISELEGKRVVVDYGAFAGATFTARSALANAGLTPDDVQPVRVSNYTEGVRAVMEGRADAAVGSLGSGILQELDAGRGARLLPIDPSDEAMARVQEIGPGFVAQLVESGPVSVQTDTQVLSYSTTIYARPDLDEDVILQFMGALWDNYDELAGIHRSLTTWTNDRYASVDAIIPYHPVAIEFYKEKGVWSDELEARQKNLLNVK